MRLSLQHDGAGCNPAPASTVGAANSSRQRQYENTNLGDSFARSVLPTQTSQETCMPFANFSEIRPLIDGTEHKPGGLTVYFKCPRTGRIVEARGSFPDSRTRRFAQMAAGSTARALLHRLSGIIRRLTGIYIPLGNAFQAGDLPGAGSGFATDADREAAAVDAFRSVALYPGMPKQRGRFNFEDGQWVFIE